MTISVTYTSCDGVRDTRKFKTVEGARKYAQYRVGKTPELGRGYAVSSDGVGTVAVAGITLTELFKENTTMATELKTKTLREVPAYTQGWIISNIKPNPKRAGCAAHYRYEKLNEGMKLEDAKIVLGKHFAAEMAWNVARSYFDLVDPTSSPAADAAEGTDVTEGIQE